MENDRRRGSRSRQVRLLAGILISSIAVTAAGAGGATGATAVAATRANAAPAAAPAAHPAAGKGTTQRATAQRASHVADAAGTVGTVPFQSIDTSGPFTHVYIGGDLSCQVSFAGDPNNEWYPAGTTQLADCGTFLAVGGTLYAPNFGQHQGTATGNLGTYTPFTFVSQSAVAGTGTSADPYRVTTVVNAGSSGLQLTETDSYVTGANDYRTDVQISNTSGGAKSIVLYRAGDCYLGNIPSTAGTNPDTGYGNVITPTATTVAVECTKNPASDPSGPGRVEAFQDFSGGARYLEAFYADLWSAIATQGAFNDTVITDTLHDNAAGLSYNLNIPAGGSTTVSGGTIIGNNQPIGTPPSGPPPPPVSAIPLTQTLGIVPTSGTHCTTVTITGTSFAPSIPVTPTLVYSNTSGVTVTAPITLSTPPDASGAFTQTETIPSDVAYGTTAVFSVTAPYTLNIPGGFPTFTMAMTPTVANSPVGPGLVTGPLGPVYAVGQPGSLNITGSGGFLPNAPITLTLGLSGTTASVITTTGLITADATGAFTATTPYTPSVAGTYVLTATDSVTNCNVATTTLTVYPAPIPGPPVATQYFAEGYTGQASTNGKASYLTTFDVLNPNVTSVVVTTTYLLETIDEDITTTTSLPDVVVVTHTLPALADVRIDAATDISSTAVITGPDAGKVVSGLNQKFATRVDTAGFQGVGPTAGLGGVVRGVAVERTIERTSTSGARDDGDVSLGTTAANTSYYFAEGYTGGNFQEYLLLFNPSPTLTATVQLVRVPEGGATTLPPIGPFVLAPQQRLTLNMRRLNVDSSEKAIGLIVNSLSPNPNDTTPSPATPIVAERTEYFGPGDGSARPGETIGVGLTTAAKQLNFAYGSLTGTGDVAATITPTAELAQTQDDRPFIEVVNPNIAGQVIAGTLSGSATAPGPAAHVTIQLRSETGRLLGFFITDVDAGARFTLTYSDLTGSASGIGFPGIPSDSPTRAGVFSAVVSSSERVVSELTQYYGQGPTTPSGDANSGAPGLDLVGAPTGETDVLFPSLSETDPASTLPLSQTVFLYNPGVNPVQVNGTFYGPSGVLAHQVYTIGPDAIVAIGQSSAYSSGTVAGSPIPMGTTGAEFSTIQQRGVINGEPGTAPETFVAAAVTHSADASQWWGTQGLYPLPNVPVQ